ncbi:MAG: hypothetical protein Q8N62_01430, partial [Candidatus Omnitrophota bacterium]|nr:hypothetical protein [Candidatus Omnitrophota bacterium]
GGSLLTTDITIAVSAASTVYTLTGNSQSITDLGADGAKALTVKIIDTANNTGTASAAANITKDVTAPNAPSGATIASGSGWNANYISNTNKAAVKVSGVKSADTIQIKIDIDDEDTFTNPKTTTLSGLGAVTTYADAEATGIDVTTATALADGNIAIRITASDTAGNAAIQTVLTGAATFKKDIIAPTAAITYSDADGVVKQGDSLTITATFSKSMADSPVPNIAISGANTLAATNMTRTDATHYTYIHTVGAGNGTSTVALSVGTDLAGNVITSAPTIGANFTVDNTAPQVAVTIANAYYVASDWVTASTINGTFLEAGGLVATTGLQVSVKREDGATYYYWDGTDWTTTPQWNNATQGAGTWTYSLANVNLSSGRSYEVTAKATDKVGNETTSAADSFVYIPILKVTRASGSGDVTAGSTVELTITAVDYLGTTITSYSGNKSLIFSGPGNAPSGTVPTVEGVNIGTATSVNFTSGVSGANLATLIPYLVEAFSLDVQDAASSTINSTYNDTFDLDLNVVAAAYDHFKVTGTASMTAGGSNELTVTAYDLYDNIATSYAGAKNLTFSGPAAAPDAAPPIVEGVTVGSPAPVTFTNGVSASAGATLTAYKAEITTVDVTDGTKNSAANTTYDLDLTVNPAAVSTISFTTQPSSTATAGIDFTSQPVITLYDAYTNVCTNNSLREVTLSAVLSSDTATAGGGTLNGTLAVTAASGVVTYSGLDYTKAENIKLKAVSTGLTTIYSNQIAVGPNTVSTISFTTQPSSTATAGIDFTSQPVITLYDANNNICTNNSTTQVTLSAVLSSDTATAGGGTLNGTLTVTAASGVVTYTGLDYTKSENIKLKAVKSGLTTIYSNQIALSPAVTYKYTLTAPPADITAGGTRAAYTVTRYDQYDNLVTSGAETVYLYTSSTGVNAAFYNAVSAGSSIISIPIASGASTANFWYYDEKSGAWTITASDAAPANGAIGIIDATDALGVTPASASKFKVTAGASTMAAGGSLTTTITAYDTYDNIDTNYVYDSFSPRIAVFSGANSSASPVTVPTFTDYGGTARNLGANTSLTFAAGVAATTMKLYQAETAHIKVTIATLATADADDLDIIVSSDTVSKLTWGTQYASGEKTVVNAPWAAFKVNVADVYGNTVVSSINVTVTPTGSSAAATSTNTVVAASGIATFSNFAVSAAGTVTLVATSGAINSVASNPVTVESNYIVSYTLKDSITAATLPAVTLTITGISTPAQDADGVFRNIALPYNAAGYTFEASKEGYVTDAQTKTPSSSEDGIDGYNNMISWIAYMTSVQESLADYKVLSSFVYVEPVYETDGTTLKSATDKLNIRLWMERRGQLIVNTAINQLRSAKVEVYDDATAIWTTISTWDAEPTAYSVSLSADEMSGLYQVLVPHIATSGTGKLLTLTAGKTYFVRCSITWGGATSATRKTYVTGATFTVTTSEKLKEATDAIKAQVTGVQALVSTEAVTTRSSVTSASSTIQSKVTSEAETTRTNVAGVKTETAKILTATGTESLPTKITEVKTQVVEQVQPHVKSAILNRESAVKLNSKVAIRYRTESGLAPQISVYSPKDVLLVSSKTMTEVGTTGVYEYTVTFLTGWGKGDFTVICSETTKGTVDALVMTVTQSDLEDVSGQVSAVLGSTSGLSGFKNVAETIGLQFNDMDKLLAQISKDVAGKLGDAQSAVNDLAGAFKQLEEMSKQIKNIGGTKGINLEKLYEVSQEKKEDIAYIKNKSEELKAVMDLNQKMLENAALKPVVQSWFEFK